MTCENALLLISGHIDGVNSDAEEAELQAHLSECADCRAVLAAFEQTETELKELEVEPPEGFSKGVMYRIGQQTGAEKKARRRFFGPGTAIGAVAAILVLMLGTGLIKLPKHDSPSSAKSAEEALPAETAAEYAGWSTEAVYEKPAAIAEGAEEADDGVWIDEKTALRYGALDGGANGSLLAEEPPNGAEPEPAETRSMVLCQQSDAPVLSYADFGTELFGVVQRYAPELGERLRKLTPERTGDGRLRFETDTRTALALHEWLLSQLVNEEDADEAGGQAGSDLIRRTQELDRDGGFLAEVITLPVNPEQIDWPEGWDDGWKERFLSGESWELCYPSADELPKGGDPAYLFLADNE